MRNGPSSSATSNTARFPSVTAAAPTTPPASTSTAACAARCYGPIPQPDPAWHRSATTSLSASPKRSPTAGSEKPKASKSASQEPGPHLPKWTRSPSAETRPNSACPPSPKLPDAPTSAHPTPETARNRWTVPRNFLVRRRCQRRYLAGPVGGSWPAPGVVRSTGTDP